MTEENKDAAVNTKEKISWKTVWVTSGIVLMIFIILESLISFGRYAYGQMRDFRDFKNQQYNQREDYQQEERDRLPFDGGRNDSFSGFIRKNLPPSASADDCRAVAELFRATAEKVDSGKLRFRSDTLAELNRGLQVVADIKWIPFFTKLLGLADRSQVKSADEMASFLRMSADAIEGARGASFADSSEDVFQQSLPESGGSPSPPTAPPASAEEKKEEDQQKDTQKETPKAVQTTSGCASGTCFYPGMRVQ